MFQPAKAVDVIYDMKVFFNNFILQEECCLMAKKEKKVLEKKNWSNSFMLIGLSLIHISEPTRQYS